MLFRSEVGVTDPIPNFSACFGSPFLVWHPTKYAELLADKIKEFGANAWLVNTGWAGGAYPDAKRMPIKVSRALIDAAHSGVLDTVEWEEFPIFNLQIPKEVPGVPTEILNPANSWEDKDKFMKTLENLATLFNKNFEQYASEASPELLAAAPRF